MSAGRDWRKVNESLVRRGELLLDLEFVKGWSGELSRMNEGKEGARFRYPDSLIRLLGFLHVYLHLPYRQLEGFIRALSRYVERLEVPDYSSMSWRISRLPMKLDRSLITSDQDVVIAVDATGIKVANRGDWIRHQWKVRRGFLKIHLAVDVKQKKLLSLEVTDEKTGDGRMLKPLVEQASQSTPVSRAVADGAYDSKNNFHYLASRGIEPCIKVRRSSTGKARGCFTRKLVAQEYLKDPDGWKRRHRYGQRWMAETAISSFKRMFGEHVTAHKWRNMIRELYLKANLYNLFITLTATTHMN